MSQYDALFTSTNQISKASKVCVAIHITVLAYLSTGVRIRPADQLTLLAIQQLSL